jgi:IBR domain, a half RING-finger domain
MDFGLEIVNASIQREDLENERREVQHKIWEAERQAREGRQKLSTIDDQIAAVDLYQEELRERRVIQHAMQRLMDAEDESEDEENDELAYSDGEDLEGDTDTPSQSSRTELGEGELECTVCKTSYPPPQTIRLPCQDTWCISCVVNRFKGATINGDLWPPNCCQTKIPLKIIVHILSPETYNGFLEKSVEWSTTDRTYCFRPTCSTFTSPDSIRGRSACCPACEAITCAQCKAQHHISDRSAPCVNNDAGNAMVKEVARQNG